MHTYLFLGQETIELVGYGLVAPGQIIEVAFSVNHPLFKEESKKEK